MSALTRKRDEARRLLELYTIYKDSPDDWRRRKAHLDLDRFLMENRETAIICIEQVLSDEIDKEVRKLKVAKKTLRPPWPQRLVHAIQRRREGGVDNGTPVPSNAPARDA